jgi:hypothetical protein
MSGALHFPSSDELALLRSPAVTQACAITGGYRLMPQTIEQARQLLALANQAKHPLYYNVTKASLHKAPSWLDVSRLNQVLDYNPNDLTITVETGITMGDLATVVEPHNQCFPLCYPPDTLLLDVLGEDSPAINSGLGLAQRGYPRDWVLGLTLLSGEGVLSHCGGKVVKNVTGYDLCKLYVGNQHQLGLIGTATLRLMPKTSKSESLLALGFTKIQDALLASQLIVQQAEVLGLRLCEVFFQNRLSPTLQEFCVLQYPGITDWVLLQADCPEALDDLPLSNVTVHHIEALATQAEWLQALMIATDRNKRDSNHTIHDTNDNEMPLALELALPLGHWEKTIQQVLNLISPLCRTLNTPLYPGCQLTIQGRPAIGLLSLAWQGPKSAHSQQIWGQPDLWLDGLSSLQSWLQTIGGQLTCLKTPPCLATLLTSLHPQQQYPAALSTLHHSIVQAYQQPLYHFSELGADAVKVRHEERNE